MSREQADRDIYTRLTIGAAVSAATIAVGGPIAAFQGTPIFSTGGALGAGALASSHGTGAISAAINTGSQYVQKGNINPVDVAAAYITGVAGAPGGFVRNVAINFASGATTTAINNLIYDRNDSIIGAAITSGLLSSVGYSLGKISESWINSSLRPTINNSNEWTASGIFSGGGWNLFRQNAMSVIGGTIGGGATQEAMGPIFPTPSSGANDK